MPRYIDADALHSVVARALDANEAATDVTDAVEQEHRVLYWMLEKIEEQTIISPDEVRGVGEWIKRFDGSYGHGRTYCSTCGKHSGIGGIKQTPPYCPNCGAKMEVEDDA